jgi:hypothetical protein
MKWKKALQAAQCARHGEPFARCAEQGLALRALKKK